MKWCNQNGDVQYLHVISTAESNCTVAENPPLSHTYMLLALPVVIASWLAGVFCLTSLALRLLQ